MEALKNRYREQAHFVTLYSREAHAGQGQFRGIAQPETYEQRLALAERTQKALNLSSLLLIDELDNRVKTAYGALANSAYVIGQDRLVFHKQQWTDAKLIEPPLKALLAMGGRGGEKPPAFPTGELRPTSPGIFDPDKPLASYKDAPISVPAGKATEIVWQTDLAAAKKLARETETPLLIEFYFDSCGYCQAMARGPLRAPEIVQLSRKFINVKLDLETEAAAKLAEELELIGTPAFAIFSPKGDLLQRHTGYAETDVMNFLLRGSLETALRRYGPGN